MTLKRNSTVSLLIEGIGSDGKGFGHLDGVRFLVPGGLPGDRAEVRVGRVRPGLAEGSLLTLVTPGIPRIPPVCEHFGSCGGCLWQGVSYGDQVRMKETLVWEALGGLGVEVPWEDSLPAESPFFYRNKMEFSFGGREGEVILGLHLRGRFDRVFDLGECHLQSRASNRVVDVVRTFARTHGLRPYDLKRHLGLLRFLTVREGKGTGEMMVNLVTSEEPFPERDGVAQAIVSAAPEVVTVLHTVNRRKAQIATGDEVTTLRGEGFIRERLSEFSFRISPTSFFQTNPVQAERLYELVCDYAALSGGARVLDLYCGTGAIAMYLARRAGTVIGVESSQEAVRDALRNCAENGVSGCQFIVGDAGAVLDQLRRQGERFEAVAVDPPRVGMHPDAVRSLIALAPHRIVYVSCNPDAMASDLSRMLAAGYRIERARLVDLFPQTPHCETVVKLVRG